MADQQCVRAKSALAVANQSEQGEVPDVKLLAIAAILIAASSNDGSSPRAT
jgi:hypothetical protein